MSSTWRWIARDREKIIILESLQHLKVINDVALDLINMFKNVIVGDYVKALENQLKLEKNEKTADDIKRKIIVDLTKSTIHPMDREDLLKIVFTSDDIAAYLKASSHKLRIMLELKLEVKKEVFNEFVKIVELISKSIEHLTSSLENLPKDSAKSLEYTNKVEEIEENIDDVKIKILEGILSECSIMSNVCLLTKEILDDLEMASDKCEDVADAVRAIVAAYS